MEGSSPTALIYQQAKFIRVFFLASVRPKRQCKLITNASSQLSQFFFFIMNKHQVMHIFEEHLELEQENYLRCPLFYSK